METGVPELGARGAVAAVPSEPEVVLVAVAALSLGVSFRDGGVDDEHVERLVGSGGQWPAILVRRRDGVVVDGAHRVVAARRLGLDRIEVSWFEGGRDEALIEFVRRNVSHGLPLSLAERKRAASRVLATRPEWSDRRIAEVCGVSPKTVGRIRVDERGRDELPLLEARVRVGRDDRLRPVNSAALRERIAEVLIERPDASLRAVAATVGVSPETVRQVRLSMAPRRESTETEQSVAATPPVLAAVAPLPAVVTPLWGRDPALSSCDGGQDFLDWFDRSFVHDVECLDRVETVPLSRVYEIADEARRRSEAWMRFARALEGRAGRR
ncbi:MAG TPA: ParB/RepB/Spo0J family partition protein [Acidimicrobiales bacterium]